MPGTTTNFGITYSEGIDEVKKFPAQVSAVGAKKIDEVLYERLLNVEVKSGSFSAVSGKLYEMTTNGATCTLPSVAINATVAIFCGTAPASVKITAGSAKIYGDFINGETVITLTTIQHVILQSNGTNWFIMAGEPKREATWSTIKSYSKVEVETGLVVSSSRPGYVMFGTAISGFSLGGVAMVVNAVAGVPYYLNPGQVWKGVTACEAQTLLL